MENNNSNKMLVYIAFVLVAVFGVIYFFMQNNLKPQPPVQNPPQQEQPAPTSTSNLPVKYILYYGSTCSHCKVVEEYMQKNDTQSKIGIQLKEVFNNQQNSNELVAKAKICGLATDGIGVPFLFDLENSKCIIGDQPIIDLFESLIKK